MLFVHILKDNKKNLNHFHIFLRFYSTKAKHSSDVTVHVFIESTADHKVHTRDESLTPPTCFFYNDGD